MDYLNNQIYPKYDRIGIERPNVNYFNSCLSFSLFVMHQSIIEFFRKKCAHICSCLMFIILLLFIIFLKNDSCMFIFSVGVSFSFTLSSAMLRLAESSVGEIDILLKVNGRYNVSQGK
jgi:hypothetical protein